MTTVFLVFAIFASYPQATLGPPPAYKANSNELVTGENTVIGFRHECGIMFLTFSRDGTLLGSTGETDGIRVWSVINKKQLCHIKRKLSAWEFAFSPDNKRIAYCEDDGLYLSDIKRDSKPHLVAASRQIKLPSIDPLIGRAQISSVVFANNGKILAWADCTGDVKIINLESGSIHQVFQGAEDTSNSFDCLVRISPDDKLLAYTKHDGKVVLWDIETKKNIDILDSSSKTISSLQFAEQGTVLGFGAGTTFHVLDFKSKRVLGILGGHKRYCVGAFSSTKGEVITFDESGIIRIWDYSMRRVLRSAQGPKGGVTSLAVSPDAKRFATTGEQHSITLWDTTKGMSINQGDLKKQ